MHTILLILLWPTLLVGGTTAALMLAGYVHDRWCPHIDIGAWFVGTVFLMGFALTCFL